MTGADDETPSAPEPLGEQHDLSDFDSGQPSLDDWLRRRARANQAGGASRSFVVPVGTTVVAFYSLSATAIAREVAAPGITRNMPNPIPMLLIGRLAVDRRWQGRGIADGMMGDAVLRALQVAEHAGVRGLLVHAISEEAARFYRRWDFTPSRADPLTMMVRLDDIARTLKQAD